MARYRIIEIEVGEPVGTMFEVQKMEFNILIPYGTNWTKITGDRYFLFDDAKEALRKYKTKREDKIKVAYSE
jgi:hypothetical protein